MFNNFNYIYIYILDMNIVQRESKRDQSSGTTVYSKSTRN